MKDQKTSENNELELNPLGIAGTREKLVFKAVSHIENAYALAHDGSYSYYVVSDNGVKLLWTEKTGWDYAPEKLKGKRVILRSETSLVIPSKIIDESVSECMTDEGLRAVGLASDGKIALGTSDLWNYYSFGKEFKPTGNMKIFYAPTRSNPASDRCIVCFPASDGTLGLVVWDSKGITLINLSDTAVTNLGYFLFEASVHVSNNSIPNEPKSAYSHRDTCWGWAHHEYFRSTRYNMLTGELNRETIAHTIDCADRVGKILLNQEVDLEKFQYVCRHEQKLLRRLSKRHTIAPLGLVCDGG